MAPLGFLETKSYAGAFFYCVPDSRSFSIVIHPPNITGQFSNFYFEYSFKTLRDGWQLNISARESSKEVNHQMHSTQKKNTI
jgi:hypothetical protein